MKLSRASVIIAAGVLVTTTAVGAGSAQAGVSSGGCNHKVCLDVDGSAASWWGRASGSLFWGHVDIISPDGHRTNGADGQNPTLTVWDLSGHAGQVCAEGWQWLGDRYGSVGLPCVTVS